MNITSHTAPVTNTQYIPYITDREEESWLGGVIPNYNPCGDETSMPIGFHRRREDEPGNSPDGLWDLTLLPSSAPINHLDKPLTLTDTYSRCHRVSHEWVSQVGAATEATLADSVVDIGQMLTQEDIELAIRQMTGEDVDGGEGETELQLQDDQVDPCDGQKTSTRPQTPVMTATTDPLHLHAPLPMTMNTIAEEEEAESEKEELDIAWSSIALKEDNGTKLTWNRKGRRFNATWKEGFERARRNLSSNFNIPDAYSLGKLIVEGEERQVYQSVLKYLGEYYRKVVIRVYQLHEGCEGQWETTLKPRDYYRLPMKEIQKMNREKRSAQK